MPRGRPELYPVKKLIRFDQEMLDAIDDWRRQETPIPPVTDAIRRLIELGLAAKPVGDAAHATKRPIGTKTTPPKKTHQRRS